MLLFSNIGLIITTNNVILLCIISFILCLNTYYNEYYMIFDDVIYLLDIINLCQCITTKTQLITKYIYMYIYYVHKNI